MASASTLLALSVVLAKYSNQNLQDIARRKNMLEMCIQGIDMLIDCKAVYASPRRCKALLDAAIAAAKRTSALSAEEMIAQANTTTTTVATTSSPAVEVGNAKEEKEEDRKENIEISRSFDARRLRRKRRINRGGRVKMSAFSKRREQESAKYRYGGAVGRKRSRDIRNYEVASESDGTDDDDNDYYDDEEQGGGGGYGAAAIMEEFEPSDIDESDDDESDDNNDNNDGGFGMRGGGITGWG